MIRFQRITTADAALYGYMERLMQASFPAEEYRDLAQLRLYTDARPQFCNNVILLDEVPVGLFTYWDFGDFLYAEHFAVDPARRNGGVGRDALRRGRASGSARGRDARGRDGSSPRRLLRAAGFQPLA